MPFINTYISYNKVYEIYNNRFYKTYSNVVYGYGDNGYGQLGIGSQNKVLIEEKIKDIKIYNNRTYFITINSEVYACGENYYRHLGVGSYKKSVCIPQKVLIEEKIKDILIYDECIYFITINDEVYAYGQNYYGQLGVGLRDYVVCSPQKVLIEEKIKDIKLNRNQSYFITFNDKVYASGQNYFGKLGIGSHNEFVNIPQKVLIEEKIKDIRIYDERIYFITINNEFYTCGQNYYGQLGVGPHDKIVCIPQKVLLEEKIKDIKTFYNLTYFILINDEVYSCGDNEVGQLGIGSYDKVVYIPQKVLIEEKIKDIKIYNNITYFITINDKVYTCGRNKYDQLGIGSCNEVACIPQKVLIEKKNKRY